MRWECSTFDMSNGSMCLYLSYLKGCDSWRQRDAGLRARDILSCLLVKLKLRQQGLLLLPQQMQPLLLLQLPLPLQLMLFLAVVVVEHFAPGTEIDVLFPQYVNQVHLLERQPQIALESCELPRGPAVRIQSVLEQERATLLLNVAVVPATPCPFVSAHLQHWS